MSRDHHVLYTLFTTALLAAAPGCGLQEDDGPMPARWAGEVVSFEPGPGAGYGQDNLPDVILGPPQGQGNAAGSLDVLSLGEGGEVVLGFGEARVVDGEGADFVVFENAFLAAGDPARPYAELGEVAVSQDGERWEVFRCEPEAPAAPGRWPGCAGWRPSYPVEDPEVPIDIEAIGGDPFDLAEVGLEEARFVRIRDVSRSGSAPGAGFDLDAVGLVHWQ